MAAGAVKLVWIFDTITKHRSEWKTLFTTLLLPFFSFSFLYFYIYFLVFSLLIAGVSHKAGSQLSMQLGRMGWMR